MSFLALLSSPPTDKSPQIFSKTDTILAAPDEQDICNAQKFQEKLEETSLAP